MGRVVTMVVFALSASAAQAQMYGIDFDGILYDVNPSTGLASNPRPTGLANPIDLEFDDQGHLYTVTANNVLAQAPHIYQLDAHTGASTFVADVQGVPLNNLVEGDLAFRNGQLFATTAPFPSNGPRLYTISLTSGMATPIGGSGLVDVSGLSFDLAGNLWAVDHFLANGSSTLLRLDPGNGATLSSAALGVAFGSLGGMDVDPVTGSLYVADGGVSVPGTDSLYTLDPTSGALTLVGPLGLANGLAGIAVVPEPASAMCLLTGAATLARRRRKVTNRT